MKAASLAGIGAATAAVAAGQDFDPLKHLAGNGQWFSGPNAFGIDPKAPEGCTVDQAAFVSRHGSRYPDPGAYAEWTALEAKIQAATFTTNATELEFLHDWKPVLTDPSQQISQLSLTGWKELYDMGVQYRLNYPSFSGYNAPFTLWANEYASSPRVLNSAQLFARGYLGPNATTLGSIYVVNGSAPASLANSLATSNLCPAYSDNGGGDPKDEWDSTYLPPATDRINALLRGNLTFSAADVGIFAYLCGFETQITGARSPWCGTLTPHEFLQYEYAQDLRYWYGNGAGNGVAKATMLPFLQGLVQRFRAGPGATYVDGDGAAWAPPPLVAAFTNDGQVSQLAAAVGVFDGLPDLPGDRLLANRTFRASSFVTMRGTVGFERLNCGSTGTFLRVKLNDVVYPVSGCDGGPGRSCELEAYGELIERKLEAVGGFREVCNVTDTTVPEGEEKTTFLWDRALSFEKLVRP
ncbi:Histidine phosphatase superfamily clade-2 [Macrophomina phaseolina MS6]|uniref:3-phytase n=1 Tax=Macrophomina phaseolina (strain MS6) TaxID=1126212 RepID=K2S6F3_MACPH|nr:Histidine phosphatase superfamily clade-2 [Macrophomina phaseolina MS6]